jgi:hypothetical protein
MPLINTVVALPNPFACSPHIFVFYSSVMELAANLVLVAMVRAFRILVGETFISLVGQVLSLLH